MRVGMNRYSNKRSTIKINDIFDDNINDGFFSEDFKSIYDFDKNFSPSFGETSLPEVILPNILQFDLQSDTKKNQHKKSNSHYEDKKCGVKTLVNTKSKMVYPLDDKVVHKSSETNNKPLNIHKALETNVENIKYSKTEIPKVSIKKVKREEWKVDDVKEDDIDADNFEMENIKGENYKIRNSRIENFKVDNAKSDKAKIENAKIENAKVENAKVENAKVENVRIENAKVENAKVGNVRIENAKVENVKVESAKVESAKVETAKIENAKVENAKVENAKVENAKVETAKIENVKVENAKVENAKVENAKIENIKVENTKVENIKVENAKVENAKVDNIKVDNVRIENSRVENIKIENPKIENFKIENDKVENVKIETIKAENHKIENPKMETIDNTNIKYFLQHGLHNTENLSDLKNRIMEETAIKEYGLNTNNNIANPMGTVGIISTENIPITSINKNNFGEISSDSVHKNKNVWSELTIDMIGTSFKVIGDIPNGAKLKIVNNTHLAEENSFVPSVARYLSGQNRDEIISFLDHLFSETERNIWIILDDIRSGVNVDTNISVLQSLIGKTHVFLHRYEHLRSAYNSDSSAFARLGIIRDKFFAFLNALYRNMVIPNS